MTTKTDYSKLTDQELDKLAAETFMDFEVHHEMGLRVYDNQNRLIEPWNPTHPDSNQAERYLFPKLLSKCTHIEITFNEVHGIWVDIVNDRKALNKTCWNENANRSKVISCLEAWEKLNV